MRDILEKFNMDKCNVVNTLVANGLKLSKEGEGEFVNSTVYKSLVGSLRCLIITKPDIVYGVGLVSRYMETPRESHWLATKRILRYMIGILNYDLFYNLVKMQNYLVIQIVIGDVTKVKGKPQLAFF